MKTNNNSDNILLNKIKSKYKLKNILNNLSKKKFLELIKYNKQFQNTLEITIEDYKKFAQIEIELYPAENVSGKFINIKKEDEYCFHIYFNDNKEEKKINTISSFDNIQKIKIIIDNEFKSISGLFKDCETIKKINFIKFTNKDILNMNYMFYGCTNLKELLFSKFKTDKVINMRYMFYNCCSLTELNLSNFNTYNVTDMNNMFGYCSKIKQLDLSNFYTNKVKNMEFMFSGCYLLNYLNISNFKINKDINMHFILNGCPEYLKIKFGNKVIDKLNFERYYFLYKPELYYKENIRLFNENGELEFEGSYNNGIRWNGKGKEYRNGKLIFEGEYICGNKVSKALDKNKNICKECIII